MITKNVALCLLALLCLSYFFIQFGLYNSVGQNEKNTLKLKQGEEKERRVDEENMVRATRREENNENGQTQSESNQKPSHHRHNKHVHLHRRRNDHHHIQKERLHNHEHETHDIPLQAGKNKVSNSSALRVFIMEEHQHALPIWFMEAQRQGIEKFTLVHIDAHADLGVPGEEGYMSDLPTYVSKHILSCMNDEFILYAGLHGLLDRIIWVLPDWTQIDGDLAGDVYVDGHASSKVATLLLGYAVEEWEEDGIYVPCSCNEFINEEGDIEVFDCQLSDPEEELYPEECNITVRIPLQVTAEYRLQEVGFELGDDVIFDFDEDFFSTEDVMRIFMDTDWTNKTLKLVDNATHLFCASSVLEDNAIGALLEDIVRQGLKTEHFDLDITRFLCLSTVEAGYTPKSALQHFANVVEQVLGDDKAKRQALLHTGFCNERSALYNKPSTMCLCVGAHSETEYYTTNPLVTFFTPTEEYLQKSLATVRSWMTKNDVHKKTRIVTLCRSVRDGYLPRRLQERIEAELLDMFKTFDPHFEAIYDDCRPNWSSLTDFEDVKMSIQHANDS